MKQKNPKSIFGVRKFECPFYDDCLDDAAKEDWPQFTCEFCPNCKPSQTANDGTNEEGLNSPEAESLNEFDDLTIAFFKYVNILNDIKRGAVNNYEKVDLELKYILKSYFEDTIKYKHLTEKYF